MADARRYFTTGSVAALSRWLAGADAKQLGRWSIAAAGLLLALAATLAPPGNPALAGHTERIAAHVPAWAAALAALPFVCALLFVLALLRPRLRRRRRKGDDDFQLYFEPQRLTPATALAMSLILAAPLTIIGAAVWWYTAVEPVNHETVPAGRAAAPPLPPSASGRRVSSIPRTDDALTALAAAAGAVSLAFVLWLYFDERRERSHAAVPGAGAAARLAIAVDESLDDLRREAEPRVAIIKCYRRFERLLAQTDAARQPWQTPLEFVRCALRQFPLPSEPVERLVRLFELSRFSHHALGTQDRDNAWTALAAIKSALAGKDTDASSA